MKFFPSRTTFIQFGSLTVQWYAVLILTGVFLAYLFAKKNLETYRNVNRDEFLDEVLTAVLFFAIITARLWYCLFSEPSYYFSDPVRIIRIWDGGLAIHGGLIGGFVTAWLMCRKRNVPFLKFMDGCLPTILIGQAMGRWGNFVNQECYGATVPESYYDGILHFIKNDMFIDGAYREPMFLYESLLCIVGFILINFILRKYQNKRGDLMYAYLMWYGLIRFFIEGRRTDALTFGPLKMAQVTSLLFLIVGTLLYVRKEKNRKKPTMLFDLDGTLQDSEKAIIATYTELFRRHDKVENFTPERQVEVLGPPLQEMFRKFWPDLDPEELFKEYQTIIKVKLSETLEPMPGAVELLKTLKEKGYNVGIVSTRIKASGMYCLELMGVKDYVDDYFGVEEVKKTKPDPDGLFGIIAKNRWNSADVIMTGDSTADIKAGKAYGAYTVAYLSKPEKEEAVRACEPNYCTKDLLDILKLLESDNYFTYNLK